MADFRKAKYSGSLNMAPECGPVRIELDTDAKTATASLEDPASQYTLTGGGGGLDYVIPEQTLHVYSNESLNIINDVDVSGLENGDKVIAKIVMPNESPTIKTGIFTEAEGDNPEVITIIYSNTEQMIIGHIDNQWELIYLVEDAPGSISALTIAIIKVF